MSNSSNSSNPSNNTNGSISPPGGQSSSSSGSKSLVPAYTVIPILSLTILFAITYIIIIVVRPTFRSNKLNYFVMNICVTSVLLSIFMLPSNIQALMGTSSSLPCKVQSYLPIMSASQMMYSHVIAAISRCLTIVYPNKHMFRSTLSLFVFIVFGWFLGFGIAIPYVIFDGFACTSSSQASFLPYYTLVAILFTPALSICICNLRILWYVRQSTRRVHNTGGGNNPARARDIRLIKTMVVTYLVFISGWTPLLVQQTFSNTFNVPKTVDALFQVLPTVSMLFDVLLLIYTNQPVRLYLWQLIRHIRPRN